MSSKVDDECLEAVGCLFQPASNRHQLGRHPTNPSFGFVGRNGELVSSFSIFPFFSPKDFPRARRKKKTKQLAPELRSGHSLSFPSSGTHSWEATTDNSSIRRLLLLKMCAELSSKMDKTPTVGTCSRGSVRTRAANRWDKEFFTSSKTRP